MRDFSHTVSTDGDRLVVSAKGELDTHTAVEFKRALLELIEDNAEIVVDLGGLTFIDSSGLSVFIAAHKRSLPRGARVLLDGVPPFLSRILAITGLNAVIPLLGGAPEPA
ncbi:STAS domain-containing protein [Actinokineospora auranticolor]|uniref:Anti-sigma factor antagonist n=1 Tax=Actinokineospora auranticolor TaxID=155976 RepID=A0A2S6GQP7_9PSEU|nr:STAS domain-containing protein [Actinokineospora auranticolor]PPK67516.1 anti-sigma B factor antagonist [Actinokineospora auranticolor]